MDENLWESVPEPFEADLTPQETLDLAIAKVHRFKAASLEAGVAIRKALPIGARVQFTLGGESWKGTIISPQGAICDHVAGPVMVLPDEGSDVEPDCTTGEVQVDTIRLTALTNEKWNWQHQAMRLAHAAAHVAEAASIEVALAVHRLMLVGSTIQVYLGDHPAGGIRRAEVISVGMYSTSLHVRVEGRAYGPENESSDIVDLECVRSIDAESE